MLHFIVVTPDILILNLPRELDHLWSYLEKNGVLINPKLKNLDWITFITSLDYSPSLRDKTLNHLKRLHMTNRIVDYKIAEPDDPNETIDWLGIALRLKSEGKIDAIITTENARIKLGLSDDTIIDFPISSYAPYIKIMENSWSLKLYKSEEVLRETMFKILRGAHAVRMVDPYAYCEKPQYEKTLMIISEPTFRTIMAENGELE